VINLTRVAHEIKNIGLYDLILQDVQNITGIKRPSEDEILETINTHPQVLESYKQTNVEYNIGNIHIKDIAVDGLEASCKKGAKEINKNLASLRELEKYTLDFEQSATLVIIFSVEFFVLFSVQYFIVLLDLKAWQGWIYGMFASSVIIAWWYAKKEQKKYAKNKILFETLYQETQQKIDTLEAKGCIKKSALVIHEGDDHV